MLELAWKDLEQHAKPLAIFSLVALATPGIFYWMTGAGKESAGFVGVAFGYIVMGYPVMLTFYLIGQEKAKGTMKFLKLLPLSGRWIIFSKSLTVVALSLSLLNFVVILEPLLMRWIGFGIDMPNALLVFWMNLAAIFLIALGIAAHTAFDHRLAGQIGYLVIVVVMLLTTFIEKYMVRFGMGTPEQLFERVRQSNIVYWGAVPVMIASVLLFLLSARILEGTEWSDLEEG
jgi:hypothetical protein